MLIGAAIDVMAGVVRPLGTALPVGPDHPGRTTGFGFEMFYPMGNLVPWREPAWALLHERLALLVERCTQETDAHEAVEAVQEARQRASTVAESVAAHVPLELRASG